LTKILSEEEVQTPSWIPPGFDVALNEEPNNQLPLTPEQKACLDAKAGRLLGDTSVKLPPTLMPKDQSDAICEHAQRVSNMVNYPTADDAIALTPEQVNRLKDLSERLAGVVKQPQPKLLSIQEVIQKATVAIIETLHEIEYADLTDASSEVLTQLRKEVEDPNWIRSS